MASNKKKPKTRKRPMTRSEVMSRVRSKHTKPEILVRNLVRSLGYKNYRLHGKRLPGKPDLVWPKLKTVIFVNGCFWHRHSCKNGKRLPKSRLDYWIPKLERNKQRDAQQRQKLKAMDWKVLTVWQCQTHDVKKLSERIEGLLKSR